MGLAGSEDTACRSQTPLTRPWVLCVLLRTRPAATGTLLVPPFSPLSGGWTTLMRELPVPSLKEGAHGIPCSAGETLAADPHLAHPLRRTPPWQRLPANSAALSPALTCPCRAWPRLY